MHALMSLKPDLLAFLPVLILWGGACLVLLGDALVWRGRSKSANVGATLLVILAALSPAAKKLLLIEPGFAFSGSVVQDGLSASATVILLITAMLATMIAPGYLAARGRDRGEYYVLLLMSTSGAILMASAGNLIILFLGLELLSFGLYVMAGFDRTEARSEEASLKYFLLGAFASAILLYGIAMLYGASGKITTEGLRVAAAGGLTPMLGAGLGLVLVGLAFKAGLVPFHQWSPDVYQGSPTSATAFMAAAVKTAVFASILRLLESLQALHGAWGPVLTALSVLTMVVGNLMALGQDNVKRMLAYSSIAHAGYLTVAVVATSTGAAGLAGSGVIFYLLAYALTTMGAFGVLAYLTNTGRDVQTLADLRGLARRDPFAAYSMLAFMLSLAGVPPTIGFMAKWQIFVASLQAGNLLLTIVMALTSVVAAFYYLKVVWVMFFEETAAIDNSGQRASVSSSGRAAVAISLTAVVLLGVMPGLVSVLTTIAQ